MVRVTTKANPGSFAGRLAYVISFNFSSSPVKKLVRSPPFYRWRD